jgi:hypothetical protein
MGRGRGEEGVVGGEEVGEGGVGISGGGSYCCCGAEPLQQDKWTSMKH